MDLILLNQKVLACLVDRIKALVQIVSVRLSLIGSKRYYGLQFCSILVWLLFNRKALGCLLRVEKVYEMQDQFHSILICS